MPLDLEENGLSASLQIEPQMELVSTFLFCKNAIVFQRMMFAIKCDDKIFMNF